MVVAPNKKKVGAVPKTENASKTAGVFNTFHDVTPQDILKNLKIQEGDSASGAACSRKLKPSYESTTVLVSTLSKHFSSACLKNAHHLGRSQLEAHHKKLKETVYSNLLSYRKEYDHSKKASSPIDLLSHIKASEVDDLIWMTHVFVQQRRFDDANNLNKCLETLREEGHLGTDTDVRQVLKFLVALKGCGEKQVNVHLPAKITPRLITSTTERPRFLPYGPLNYGDTWEYSAQHQYHFMHFPSEVFKISSEEAQGDKDAIALPVSRNLLSLPSAPPGTGVNPMIFPKDESEKAGKVLGALLQKRSGEISPDTILSVPELPVNPDEYCGFNNLARGPPPPPLSPSGVIGSDEGYDTRPSSRQVPEEDEEEVWEKVLLKEPLTKRRTWENVGHPPAAKEKPFLSEIGQNAAHNLWVMYQELWSHVQGNPQVQPLHVVERSQLCRDILYLLTGVPSVNFQWCMMCQKFIMKERLCSPGITPGHIRSALTPLIECGTYIKRLELMCSPPTHSRRFRRKGSVFHSFLSAISSFLQVHRGKVLMLTEIHDLLHLLQKVEGLVRKVKFVSSICCVSKEYESISDDSESSCTHEASHMAEQEDQPQSMDLSLIRSHSSKPYGGVSVGLNLIGDLNNLIMMTKDKEYLMLLVYMMKTTCIPFFRYLEDWIYEGICYDPELEFMIDIDSSALLQRDRRYWTHGYTLRDLSSMPPFLREVLEEAFACGKALNLLKICSPKHYLVSGVIKHPSLQLCFTQEHLEKKIEECQSYKVHMEYLAAKKEVTAIQREEQIRAEKQLLILSATKKHSDAIKLLERRIETARLQEATRKQHELKELKEEMEKASERKRAQALEELEEDRRIALEQEEIEKKQQEHEEILRAKIERYYEQLMKVAEQRETLARWKVNRFQLNESRKRFIQNYEWTKEQCEGGESQANTPDELDAQGMASANVKIEVKPLFSRSGEGHLLPKDAPNEGYLTIDRHHTDYVEPSPTEESTSGCDMSMSRMSTSSDFVDTPHDENIPELEVDPIRLQVERNDGISASTMKAKASPWGNPFIKKKQSFDRASPENQKELIPGKGLSPYSEDSKTVSERNRQKVLREEYGINLEDANANFASSQESLRENSQNQCEAVHDDDENGNLGDRSTTTAVVGELNSNITKHELQTAVNNRSVSHDADNDTNGNMYIPVRNVDFIQYQETRNQAALIKQKVLNQEFHSSTVQENFANITRSKKMLSSPEALLNKQKILDNDFDLDNSKVTKTDGLATPVSYSRQTSSTSSSAYRSCSSYDRQTSASTVFSTPDEEKPILIDQVGGEVLKERGRSIHGHASDAVIHKLLWRHEPALSPTASYSESSYDDGVITVRCDAKVQPFEVDKFSISKKEQILDISGSALHGRPSTVKNIKTATDSDPLPSVSELARFPVNFLRSVKVHLATQSLLVNRSLLSEVLVQESLLDHFTALRAFLLLHDAHFARALILNLCTKIDLAKAPASLLTPVVMNSILSKSISESCWSTSPFADNLSFAVTDTPTKFVSQTSILNCLELRYRVKWPHTLILDDAVLAMYTRLWKFLASLHYSIWAADDVFCYTSFLSREDREGNFVRCAQFHQICLFCHQMHHFLLVIQAYVTSQVHQTSWSNFEQKVHKKVASLDELYVLHSDLVNAIVSRCFLNENGAVVLKLIYEVFSLMLQFRSQLKSHIWKMNETSKTMEHPAFVGLQKTYKEFKKHATFLHKMLEEEENKLPECC